MNSRFVKILSVALLSAFLTGCIGDSNQNQDNQNSENYEEKSVDDYSKAKADFDYAKDEFSQGDYSNAAKGIVNAIGNFTSSKVNEILGYMAESRGSYRIDPNKLANHKKLKDVALVFANKSKVIATDYYDSGKKIPLGQMVLKYSSMVGSGEKPLRQRLVSTIQFHEARGDENAQLSILCNNDSRHSVDFGIGQVNTVSWSGNGSPCKGMVDENIIITATNKCIDYHTHPQNYTGVNINTYILRFLENKYGGITNLVRNPRSPFNPITNTACSYRHLNADFHTAYNLFHTCSSLESGSGGKFRCSGSSDLDLDYAAVALIAYGGITKGIVASGIRLQNRKTGKIIQTIDDYLAEFRASYSALFKEPPPF